MKHVLLALACSAAVAAATGSATNLSQNQQNTLTTIDSVPTKDQIDDAFDTPADAKQNLVAIATDPDPAPDAISIRLRAIHALAKYCGTPPSTPCTASDLAHQAVTSVITATRTANAGSDVLILRAAIETLGTMKVSADVTILNPLLNHPSRDIRAATARALRDLCNTQAISPLTERYSGELTDQVKLAISEALRILDQCSGI
ncbi:MAG TPA: HEAT repeat domain-containing protein [Kofleriaceae bacterium]